MPIENAWLVENRVIQSRMIGDITVADFVKSNQETTPLIDSGTPPVYFLVDVTWLEKYPTRLEDFRMIYRQPISKNLSYVIIFGIHNPSISYLATLITQLLRVKFQVVQDQAEALALIEKIEGRKLTVTNPDQLDGN